MKLLEQIQRWRVLQETDAWRRLVRAQKKVPWKRGTLATLDIEWGVDEPRFILLCKRVDDPDEKSAFLRSKGKVVAPMFFHQRMWKAVYGGGIILVLEALLLPVDINEEKGDGENGIR